MPIKRLKEDDYLEIRRTVYESDVDRTYRLTKDAVDDLNHLFAEIYGYRERRMAPQYERFKQKPKRKLSAWNKFVKANSNKKKFQYANGKLKLKKMGIAYRKKRR